VNVSVTSPSFIPIFQTALARLYVLLLYVAFALKSWVRKTSADEAQFHPCAWEESKVREYEYFSAYTI
jgi:hypothetical protein